MTLVQATATDNCEVDEITGVRSDGLALDEPYPVGTTTIEWTAADIHGNLSEPCTQIIIVTDDEAPSFTVPPDITICRNDEYSYNIDVSITGDVDDEADNCTPSSFLNATYEEDESNAVDPDVYGYIKRIWTLKDEAGNTTTKVQTIYVEPTPSATIINSSQIICNNSNVNIEIKSSTVNSIPDNLRFEVTVESADSLFLSGSAFADLTLSKSQLPYVITGTLINNSDHPIEVTFTVKPSIIGCGGGIPVSTTIKVNPAPRIEVTAVSDTLCNEETSVFTITTPTTLTSGEVLFDYTVDDVSGDETVISGYTEQSGVILPGAGPAIFSQKLTNHTNDVQWVRFRLHPYASNTGAATDCDHGSLLDTLIVLTVEPTPRVTGIISDTVICNNTEINYSLATSTNPIYGVRFDVHVINPHPEVTGVNNITGLEDSDIISETPSNSDDSPKMIMYIITPYTITSEGYYKCAGINDTMKLWINPTPEVIPVNVKPICSGGFTDINLITPTEMTSGIINFDFFTSNTGDIVGDTIDGEDLIHGDKISRSFFNNSDTIQSVNFWLIASNDELGCIGDTTLAEVKVHALPLQSLIITKPLTCEGGSDATLTAHFSKGATPLSVNWTGPSGYEENFTTNDSIKEMSGLEGGGVYRVTVTDNLNCGNSLDAAPVGAIFDTHFYLREKTSGYGTTCPGSDDGEIWVTQRGGSSGTPPFDYWIVYNDDETIFTGSLPSIGVTDTLKNLRPGRYKLYLHDANGCFDNSYPEINIVDPPSIEISFSIDRNITCKNYSDGSVSASVTGGIGEYSYFWYRPPYDPPLEITDTETSLDGISAGKYYLRIIDQMGCIKTDSIIIDEPEGMTLVGYELWTSNDPAFNISCNGAGDGYIKLSIEGGSGEYSYLWTGPDGFTATKHEIFNLKAGIYDCTVTDIGGCELTPHPHFELVEPDILSVTAVSPLFGAGPYNIGCFGETGSINVTVTGGTTGSYFYEWTTSDESDLIDGEGDQEHVSAGNYTLVVTDLNGCTDTTTVTLTQPAEIVLELIPTHITCQSETFDNGSINLVLSGGVEPYSYEWFDESGPIPGGILQDIFDLTPGTYTVMVTDANGCQVSGSAEVTLPPDLEYEKRISEYGDYQISCFGRSDGFIQITPTSGQGPFVFSWQLPDGSVSSSSDLSGLSAGEYILLITDSNMCTARDTILMNEPGKLMMDVTASDLICSGNNTGSITVEAVNNAGPVDYLWADGVIGNFRDGLSAGSYRIIITDSNNCNTDSTIFISEAEPMKLLFTVIQPECTDMPDGSVTVTASGGAGPGAYSYLWSDGSTGRSINTAVSGWYSVTVADINGCYVRDSVFVTPQKDVCLNIPNAISPNGDGFNDVWNIGLKELYPMMEVKIFNRWGELLWASEKGYPDPWDGRSRGATLPVDSYHYIIDLHNGSKLMIGHITIVR
jgi:gliding motility-associated-like protein